MAFDPDTQKILESVRQVTADSRTRDPNAAFGMLNRMYPGGTPQNARTGEELAEAIADQRKRDIAMAANRVMTGEGKLDTSSRFYDSLQAAVDGRRAFDGQVPQWKQMERQFGESLVDAAESVSGKFGSMAKMAKKAGPAGAVVMGMVTFAANASEAGEINTEVLKKSAVQMVPGGEEAAEGSWCNAGVKALSWLTGAASGVVVGAGASLLTTPVGGTAAGIATDIYVTSAMEERLSGVCGPAKKPGSSPAP